VPGLSSPPQADTGLLRLIGCASRGRGRDPSISQQLPHLLLDLVLQFGGRL